VKKQNFGELQNLSLLAKFNNPAKKIHNLISVTEK
jgi:hypothetical protein